MSTAIPPPPPSGSVPPPLGKPAAPPITVDARLAVVEEKLQGGNRAFSDLRKTDDALSSKIAVLEERVSPKPPNWFMVGGSLFGALVTIIGAVWLLAWLFSERPTRSEVDLGKREEKAIIDQLRTDYRDLRDQQIENRTVLKILDQKLDIIIQQRGTGRGGGRDPAPAVPTVPLPP